jgi:hypothetical protein
MPDWGLKLSNSNLPTHISWTLRRGPIQLGPRTLAASPEGLLKGQGARPASWAAQEIQSVRSQRINTHQAA